MLNWYLAHCRPREEERALLNLEHQHIETFCPFIEVKKVVRGKRVLRNEALFPGYVFLRADLEQTSSTTLRSTRGVRNLVRFGDTPCVVPKELVYDLMCRAGDERLGEQLSDLPRCGDKVMIKEGPFAGMEAIYQEADGDSRAMLLLTLLQNQTLASFANSDYTRLEK
ncbi:transcription/translation regulatory transformer protein RfaH [Oceanimonas sp. CHS3-5]|uniref:transcription/translation regulatory transformer protein RfaH n=1 Tax=Oceanimonas sp. CHS3-5 TaxID=3068186 RepID=UPI00273F6499|nr:transcription/translation regulatory transformer protein RfaH [Oceanimonas sp. CHS3-5]MDP5293721.1 transcription/translation regulatory transformer protein RfaH [Oceanimonas sp. CHS3-5]